MLQKCIRGCKNIAKMHPQPSKVAKMLQKCTRSTRSHDTIEENHAGETT